MKSQLNLLPEEWHIIESYLDEKDASRKVALFNKEVNEIPNVQQKIKYVEKIREEIEDSILRGKIKEFHTHVSEAEDSEIKTVGSKKIKFNAILYSVAAMIVVLLGIFWLMESSNTTSEKLFSKNFKPDVGLPLKMGTSNTYGFYEGMVDYKQENYKEAIAKWQTLVDENPENDTLFYFLGVANLALGNAKKSLEYLQNQDRFQKGMFKNDAAYYAALAKIKEGKFEEAKVFLETNPSAQNTQLLEQIEK